MGTTLYHQAIDAFSPICEQEEHDKKIILDLITQYPDTILTRTNSIAHLTSSAFILNAQRDMCLMVYHNIYHSWSFSGGHADGDQDLFSVACREAIEETGITSLSALSHDIVSLDILPVFGHTKHQHYVSSHLHLSATYLLIANDTAPLCVKPDENSAVAWIPIRSLEKYCNEIHMLPIYYKIIKKAESF